mmetsp:Transcript_34549/g.106099  ORF Transcript_34549/g.106099 Transcript_34549/m.106099 type:complete len:168 (-) Transcript_34549:17-520(-)
MQAAMSTGASNPAAVDSDAAKKTGQPKTPRPAASTAGDWRGRPPPWGREPPTRLHQLCHHGAMAVMSAAAQNRVPVPGPGAYDIGKKDELMVKTATCSRKSNLSQAPRFKKESAVFFPGIENRTPAPGSYEVERRACIGQYRVGTLPTQPAWSMRPRPPLEFAKTSC